MILQIIDSTGIQEIATTGVNILTLTHNTIIPNVPNEITGGIITIIIGFLIRFFEKRHLRKKGKLTDIIKENE
jgi:hypothetical protein